MHCGVFDTEKGGILAFAAQWMKLEGIILREISQTQRGIFHVLSHVEIKIEKTESPPESRIVLTRGREGCWVPGAGRRRMHGCDQCKIWACMEILSESQESL